VAYTRSFHRNHFDFDSAVPYETSQEAWDRLLNPTEVLAEEDKRLRWQLQEQNANRGCQVYNDIL
jgi:hypothetical protein